MNQSENTPDAGEVWSRFGDDLRAFILKRVHNADDADDVLQDVFVRIHRGLPALVDGRKLLPWVYRITRNAITDLYRQRDQPASLEHEPATGAPPDDSQARRQVGRCLSRLLLELPEKDREALEQIEVNDMPQNEYAKTSGLSISGAKSRIQRARQRLKQELMSCCAFQLDRFGKPTDGDTSPYCRRDCGCMDDPA
tara:strand:+ start:1005 stop:1592 length:588 start_codon:yes stop_codon:yes gene_type:complete